MTAMQRLDAAMACLDALRDSILAGIPDPPAAQDQHEALGWLLLGIHEDATVEHGAPVSEGPAPIPPGAGPAERMDREQADYDAGGWQPWSVNQAPTVLTEEALREMWKRANDEYRQPMVDVVHPAEYERRMRQLRGGS